MLDTPLLSVTGLGVRVAEEDRRILKGLDLSLGKGEVHAVMGPNGSGKSTLAKVLAGHPAYEVTGGEVSFLGDDLLDMEPDERSRAGLFMAFQYPTEVPGVSIANFLRTALQARREDDEELDLFEFQETLMERMELLEMDPEFATRHINDGFSGGEKKRSEILQMSVLQPKLALMDETDSGLDIDALKVVSRGVNALREESPDMSVLLITHYQRILNYIRPDFVHVVVRGRIVASGGPEVALKLEQEGYEAFRAGEKAAS